MYQISVLKIMLNDPLHCVTFVICSSSQQNLMLANLPVSQNILQVRRWMLKDEMMKLEGAL
jgi:hypothetical protein